jgi:biopolymer transport protein ExbD
VSFSLDEPEPEEPGMLMTSMIDIIFILLAFFVCVSEIKKGKLTVDIPQVASAESESSSGPVDPIVVEVTSKDEVFVDGEAVEDGVALEERLRTLGAARKAPLADVPLHLSGDQKASNGAMMRIMGRASKVGFQRIEFAVRSGGK